MSLSIVIPNLNYGHFISNAIESVLRNDIELELKVVDGGSTDDSENIVRSINDKRLAWHSLPGSTQSEAINFGRSASSMRLFSWLNADEFYLPGVLTKILETTEFYSDVDVIYGDSLLLNAGKEVVKVNKQHRFSRFLLRYYGPFIPSCSTFIRTSLLDSKQMLRPDLRRVMDWHLYLELDEKGARFMYVDEVIAAFTVHDMQITKEVAPIDSKENTFVRNQFGIRNSKILRLTAKIYHPTLRIYDETFSKLVFDKERSFPKNFVDNY